MSDIMRPVPFGSLVTRMVGESKLHHSIFGIPESNFYKDDDKHAIRIFGQSAHTPIGPAAGPHTQLAQNIIASYLVGGRFMELKTVQQKDDFAATGAVQKPCIDSTDEGYNVEWSTEFTLPQAWDEYAKAYLILCMLDALNQKGKPFSRSFIFNMSVGYTLEGIKTEKMQKYIDSMLDARKDSRFQEHLEELDSLLDEGIFEGTPWEGMEKKLSNLTKEIDPHMVDNVTISTMHGCPPKEIEAICTYMLSEKHIHTYVKLNPTLLGYDTAREILDANGFSYITLQRPTFEKDLQYGDAVQMLKRLVALGKKEKREFGVKLTNTLGSVNDQGRLPGAEMYMSGRSLLPLSVTVAAKISREFDGKLPISYCGGVNAMTASELFAVGLRPLTVATDMLHPGGYARMTQMAQLLAKGQGWDRKDIDVEALSALAKKARSGKWDVLEKASRAKGSVKCGMELSMTDCYLAPCQSACPIHQPIPEYVELCGEGRYDDALSLIYSSNPLPGITGYICDHQCQIHCARNDYEGAVQIRELKKIALENGFAQFRKEWEGATEKSDVKAAVIGGGPSGLAAAFFLARSGFDTTVLEREKEAGGVVRHVIPSFRIGEDVVKHDIEFIKAHGVRFVYDVKSEDETIEALRKQGYRYLFYAIGAEKDNSLGFQAEGIIPSLEFLGKYHDTSEGMHIGKHVIVTGGGNTAMDSARAAKRVEGVEDVTIVYRRTENEMPAALEEYDECLKEGIRALFLATPISLKDGQATLMKMKLGEKDASGRRRPVETGETIVLPCDTLITAIGEKVDGNALASFGIPLDAKGRAECDPKSGETKKEGVYVIGDAEIGPSTVVRCIASANAAVDDAIDKELGPEDEEHEHHHHDEDGCCCHDEDEDDEEDLTAEESADLTREEDEYFADLYDKKSRILKGKGFSSKDFAKTEAKRCMECSYLCNKCVDVCPNRANVAVDVRDLGFFDNPFQIVHVDAYCNECGNCEIFCPYEGGPYKKKFTIFSSLNDFGKSENNGFCQDGEDIVIRQDGKTYHASFDAEGNLGGDEGVSEETAALIQQIFETYSYLLNPVEE